MIRDPGFQRKSSFSRMTSIFAHLPPKQETVKLTLKKDTPKGCELTVRHHLNRVPAGFSVSGGVALGRGISRWTRTTISVRTLQDISEETVVDITVYV